MKKRYILLTIFIIVFVFASLVAIKTFTKKGEGGIKIFNVNKVTYKEYKQGDKLEFKDGEWYVMYDSSSKDDYVTLISADILFLGDEEITDVVMGIYETSDLNNYLKNTYAVELGINNLVERNGYTIRLFNEDDMKSLLKVDYDNTFDSYKIEECPEFVCLTNAFYATMIDTKGTQISSVYTNLDDFNESEQDEKKLQLKYYNITGTYETCIMNSVVEDSTLFVRPVINLKKDAIE